jgi:hypothetical protein
MIPLRQWKLSPVDQESQDKWDDYTRAKEDMFFFTSTADSVPGPRQIAHRAVGGGGGQRGVGAQRLETGRWRSSGL